MEVTQIVEYLNYYSWYNSNIYVHEAIGKISGEGE